MRKIRVSLEWEGETQLHRFVRSIPWSGWEETNLLRS